MSLSSIVFGLCYLIHMSYTATKTNYGSSTEMENTETTSSSNKVVCYSQVGCFDIGEPWDSSSRPVGPPKGPENMHTTIHFYTRDNINESLNIALYPKLIMEGVRFDRKKKTVMIVHGFQSSGDEVWVTNLKTVYLNRVDANVMIADWGESDVHNNYLDAVSSIRVVGRQLAFFVQHLIIHYQADPGRVHLIGHSLGAHICSYLAKEVSGIGRLTALDPAQVYFEGFPKEVRVDKTDAKFVEIIHTDALPFIPDFGYGLIGSYGHVDFYMNGGYDQPGCAIQTDSLMGFLSGLKNHGSGLFYCSHARSHDYFIEAINQSDRCVFWGKKGVDKNGSLITRVESQSLDGKIRAVSTTCSMENCVPFGLNSEKSPLRGVFVVTTAENPPFCIPEKKAK